MGRWKVDKTETEITDHIDFANHDHCGSEQCVPPLINNQKHNEDDKDEENYYWPFLL